MQPLSGLDASFLYLESPGVPMHVGSVLVFEGSMEFEAFRQMLASRIHLVPRMRQRLVMVPLGIGKPYWVDDPDFNIDRHLQHVGLPRPGSWRELRKMASRIFSVPLDRSRPLWEMVVVEGLDEIPQVPPGSVALISRVHHAAIDGVSGADMMGILLDISKTPRVVEPPVPRAAKPVPNELAVLAQTARKIAGKPGKIPGLVRDVARTLRAGTETREHGLDAPPAPFSAPPTPLNRTISPERCWNTALLSLDRVKAIRRAMNCTLNDVVLAICAGALRRYLLKRGALPDEPLVSMVPVSTRADDQHGQMGNRVSAMMVQLATDVEDPVERLKALHDHTVGAKAYQDAIGAQALADFAEFIPFGLAGRASRLYSRFHIAERHNPLFNVVITNVPGPQMDLYVAGHKLLATMGMAPIVDGMGLIITVLSYNGVLSLSPTSSPAVMPDIDNFARYLRESANELEEAVEAHVGKPAEDAHASEALLHEGRAEAFFAQMQGQLQSIDEAALGAGTLQFKIDGSTPRSWVVALEDRSVSQGESEAPDATLKIAERHFARILDGELDPQIAFVQGKLKIEGDVSKAMAIGALLGAG